MMASVWLAVFAGALVVIMAGYLVLAVCEELRHRHLDRDATVQVLATALRVHEVATQARQAMLDEAEGAREVSP